LNPPHIPDSGGAKKLAVRSLPHLLEAHPLLAAPDILLITLLPLVQPDQFGSGKHVALHGLFQSRFGRALQVRQHDIQRIKFEKIAMFAYRRGRAARRRGGGRHLLEAANAEAAMRGAMASVVVAERAGYALCTRLGYRAVTSVAYLTPAGQRS